MKFISITQLWWQLLLFIIGSYLIGSINFAVIISKLKKRDIRSIGSGNPGTLNMSRNFGIGIGVLTLVLDIIKGIVPTLTAMLVYNSYFFEGTTLGVGLFAKVTCGFFVVLGHVFPIFMKFKGGKGIATTIGVFAVCNIWIAIISGVIAVVFILFTEIGSMGSFIATTPGAIATCYSVCMDYIYNQPLGVDSGLLAGLSNLFVVLIIVLTWYAHRKNIERLIAGEEHPTNWLQMIKESVLKKRNKKSKS